MRVSQELLNRLAKLAQTERTVFSAYIETTGNWDNVQEIIQRETDRIMPLLTPEETEYFDVSISLFEDYIQKKREKNYSGPGLAFFIDIGADYYQGVELTIPPRHSFFAMDNEAIILPLAMELDEYEPVGVIMADASGGRIIILAGEVLENVDDIDAKVHHLSKVGGWSQMRYQRRRDKQVKHFAKEIASQADKIFVKENIRRILLAGRKEILTAIEEELSSQARNNIIDRIRWDLDATDNEFIKKVSPLFRQVERQQEKDILKTFIGELRRHGLAIAGIEDTKRALQFGQVDTLILDSKLKPTISEELTSIAEATSTYVEFVPPDNEILNKFDGVGAILRYKSD